jgi:hypothetical protein
MGFRQVGKRAHVDRREWQAWLERHAELLRMARLPPQVLATRADWEYLLRYGYHADPYPEIDFRLEELNPAQRAAFRLLLEAVLSPDERRRGCAGWHFVCPPK